MPHCICVRIGTLLMLISIICILIRSYTSIYTHTHNCLTAFGPGQPGQAGTRRNTHPLTPILIIGHPLSSSSIYNDQWHPFCSFYVLDSPLVQPLSRSSLVFLLVLDPQLHTPYISSPNHHLFVAHAHTNAACSTAIPMLCHLYLVSLTTPYLHIHLRERQWAVNSVFPGNQTQFVGNWCYWCGPYLSRVHHPCCHQYVSHRHY